MNKSKIEGGINRHGCTKQAYRNNEWRETKWRKGGKKEGRVVQERVTGGRKVRTMLNLLFIYIFVFFVPRLVMAMIGGTTPPAR